MKIIRNIVVACRKAGVPIGSKDPGWSIEGLGKLRDYMLTLTEDTMLIMFDDTMHSRDEVIAHCETRIMQEALDAMGVNHV